MRIVIVGGGLAGAKAAEQLRESGHDGEIVLLAREAERPYERPPLSKGYLLGDDERDSAFVQSSEWYSEHDVDLRLSTPATGIDLDAHVVHTDGDDVSYDKLLIATGSRPRRLALADESGASVAYLRDLDDSDHLREALVEEARVVVVGGGWIGLEVAAAARGAGCRVTLIESQALPLLGVLGPEVAQTFADLHRDHGVVLKLNATIESIGSGGVGLAGETVPADLVVVGIGAEPNVELADEAGLTVDGGIEVDEHLRASHEDVYAAGDVAAAWHPTYARRIRVEHWDNAIKQGQAAARSLLGEDVSYDELPYFFTDQYDLGMEYVGNVGPDGYDEVVIRRGDGDDFRAFWVKDGTVTAAMHVNDWDASDAIREAVGKPLAE